MGESIGIGEGNLKSYVVGFLLSVILTLLAYALVANEMLTSRYLVGAVVLLGILQMVVQVVFFLHLGQESKPRWNLLLFLFMALIVLILVFGSIWIMNNLNYNTMPR